MFQTSLLLDFISNVKWTNHATAILFFLVEDVTNGAEKIKIVNIIDTTQTEICSKYLNVAESKLTIFESDDRDIKSVDDYDSNRVDVNYCFDFSQLTSELEFLKNIDMTNPEQYNITSTDKIKGVIIKIASWNDWFDIFIPSYPVQTLNRDKTFLIVPMNEQFKSLESENIIRFWFNIFLISYHQKVLCFDFDKIEKNYWYKSELNKKASQKIQKIFDSGLIEDIEFLSELIWNEQKLRNKVLKIADESSVFSLWLDHIKAFVSTKPRFSFQYSGAGKFVIANKNQARNFITILNDDILKSELTQQEYEAESKNAVA